jgi:hypothetical protein
MINKPTTWTLTDPDIELGGRIAEARIARAERNGYRDNKLGEYGIDRRVAHYHGAWGEVAAARFLDVPVPEDHLRRFHNLPDLDPDIEVKWRKSGILDASDTDRLQDSFVLLTGAPPTLTLVGWIGGDELAWEWRAEGRWIVPTDALRPMDELRAKIKNR